MIRSDFKIGTRFSCGGLQWEVTDVGSRVVAAIIVHSDESWMKGPPYALAEHVFDEDDMKGCGVMT
jgi:hypothetical protein